MYICLIKTSEHTYIMLNDDNALSGWKSEEEALDYWKGSYRDKLGRGYESAMSACVAFIVAQPSIVKAPDDASEIGTWLESYDTFRVRATNVFFKGAKVNALGCEKWEKGAKPSLY